MKKILSLILVLTLSLLCSVALWSCGEEDQTPDDGGSSKGRGYVTEAQWRAALSETACLKDGQPNLTIRAVESWEDGERVILFADGKRQIGDEVIDYSAEEFYRSDYFISFEMADYYSTYKYDAESDSYKADAPDNGSEYHEIKFEDGRLIFHTISLVEGDSEPEVWTYYYSNIGTTVIE